MTEKRINQRPLLGLLTTGGTIAGAGKSPDQTLGYRAGVHGAAELLAAVPALSSIARFRTEAVASVDSKDITDAIWRDLARRAKKMLADPALTGVIITQGTDTLEETAYFLSLTLPWEKPVILTGAMRPASAMSADGPANLFNAVRLALSKKTQGRGVLVTMNDDIFTAATVTKRDTYRKNAFSGGTRGAVGRIVGDDILFSCPAAPAPLTFPIPDAPLAPVVILYGCAGDDGTLLRAALALGVRGIVYAGAGMGSIPAPVERELRAAGEKGIAVVRASRLPEGFVPLEGAAFDASPFLSSGALSPVKARILLQCALAQKTPLPSLEAIFRKANE